MSNQQGERAIFNLIKKGKITDFGINDPLDGFGAYFPCSFVKVVDEELMLIEVYEPSINTHHTLKASSLTIGSNELEKVEKMTEELEDELMVQKQVTLIIKVPIDFDGTDETELDTAIADVIDGLGYELVESKEYVDIEE